MITFIKNNILYPNKYKIHPEAVIISCFFNPQQSEYRLKAFNEFYESIKHMPHRIIECVIGDANPQLDTNNDNISRINTPNLLWHKEALLNKIICELPAKYKYVFWVDADVIFTNKNWVVESVKQLSQDVNILQPFEYCVHLNKDELKPSFGVDDYRYTASVPTHKHKNIWRSFSANYVTTTYANNDNYDKHGHVGFAWGAKREILDSVALYDRALIGGADHIIAHAAAGHIPHTCIRKSFTDDIENVEAWSKLFYQLVKGKIGFVTGDLYHIWHGDIEKRQYLKRIKEFTGKTKQITKKDNNGLYVTDNGNDDEYVKKYFRDREVVRIPAQDDGFVTSMVAGYMTDSVVEGTMIGGNPLGAIIGEMLNTNDERQQDIQVLVDLPSDSTYVDTSSENFS